MTTTPQRQRPRITSLHDLFHRRRRDAWASALIMLKEISANQGVLLALLFGTVGLSYVYQRSLQLAGPDFPFAIAIALTLALTVTTGQIRTFFKDADLVFLLPAESRLSDYFRQAVRYSTLIQAMLALLAVVVLYPAFQRGLGHTDTYIWTLLAAPLLKSWNLNARWQSFRRHDPLWHDLIRFVASAALAYALITGRFWWTAPLAASMLLYSIWLHRRPPARVRWADLLDREQQQLARYYTLANFFIDVPQLKNRVIRRDWAITLLNKLPPTRQHPYFYLYSRTFFRYSEYFGISIRLTIFVGVVLAFIPNYWFAALTHLAGLFLLAFQLPMLGAERRYPETEHLYPVTVAQRQQGIAHLSFLLLCLQTGAQSAALLLGPLPLLTVLVIFGAGCAFSYLLAFHYVPSRFLKRVQETEAQQEPLPHD